MTIPVLLLHCSGSSGAQWRSLVEALGTQYRAHAPDLGSAPSLATVAEPLFRNLERIGQPVHLVGHSYGGAVALHLARARPWLFRSLTLLEPSAFHLLRDGDAIDRRALAEIAAVAARVKADLARSKFMEGYGRFVDYWSGPGAWESIPADKRGALAIQLERIALEFDALLGEPARVEDMKAISLPTLLVQGGGTELPSRCICKRLRDVHPEWKFSVVRGAGHMLPFTHRDAVNHLIAAHLDGQSTTLQQEAA
jgi:pimeloyl-ACP methyl ester carboxylesterase